MVLRKILALYLTMLSLLFGSIYPLYAQDLGLAKLPSIDWQSQALEKNIRSVIQDNLSPILKSNEYLINIDIDVKRPETPDFYTSETRPDEQPLDSATLAAQAAARKLAKEEDISLDDAEKRVEQEELRKAQEELAKQEEEQKKRDELEEEKKDESILKFSDADPEETAADYILFSKFGLQAPLIDNFNDFRPDGKIILSMDPSALGANSPDTQKLKELESELTLAKRRERETIQQLKERQREQVTQLKEEFAAKEQELNQQISAIRSQNKEPSLVEQAWKYNQTLDLFANLRSVTITVTLNDKLETVTRDSVTRILNALTFSLGKVKPTLLIEYVPMDEVKRSQESRWDLISSILEKFGSTLGLLMAALVLGAIALYIYRRYEAMRKEEGDSALNLNGSLSGQNTFKNEDDQKDEAVGGGGSADGEAGFENVGIERFEAFFKKSPNDAILLVKKWIKAEDKKESDALRALVQQLENSTLMEIFQTISENDRSTWKNLLNTSLSGPALKNANLFISNAIVAEIILPSAIVDSELMDLLLKIRPKQAAEMIRKNLKMGAILLNVMNTKFVNDILDNLPKNVVEDVIDASLNYSPKMVQAQSEEMKKVLREFTGETSSVPFLQKIKELIPTASPTKEFALYKALASAGDKNTMIELAMKRTPESVLHVLPENMIKTIFTRYPLANRVEFLLALDEEDRNFYISVTAPEGSKSFELLSIELESAQENELMMKRIQNDSDAIMDQYAQFARDYIARDASLSQHLGRVVSDWVEDVYGKYYSNVVAITNKKAAS